MMSRKKKYKFALIVALSVIPFLSFAQIPSYPSCSEIVLQELQTKLRSKISLAYTLSECLLMPQNIFFRGSEPLQSSAHVSYDVYSTGEANTNLTSAILSNALPNAQVISLLDAIEANNLYKSFVPTLSNPTRYVNMNGPIVGIEGINKGLYFVALGPTARIIKQTNNATVDSNAGTLDLSPLHLAAANLTWDFPPTIPPSPPPPGPTPPLQPPPPPPVVSSACHPSLLVPVAFGERSESVRAFQTCLLALGYSIPAGATGYYGSQTRIASQKFYLEKASLSWNGLKFGPLGIQTMRQATSQ